MTVTGSSNRWIYIAFVLFAGFILAARWAGDKADVAPLLFLFLTPMAAGTGLLAIGRRGELDLLFGAGRTRAHLWWNALWRGWTIPALLGCLIVLLAAPLHEHQSIGALLVRSIAVLLFTGGVSFAVGFIEPRQIAGVVWLLLRLIFVMTPPGLSTVTRLAKGVDMPSQGSLALAVILAPETMLETHMPVVFAIVAALIGTAAMAASRRWFTTADFGGKRS